MADIARKKGATLIVITASASPLAQITQANSQILLAADHPEDFDRYSPMVSRMLHLMIIDILTTGVALRLGQGLRPALQEIKRNLRARRYADAGTARRKPAGGGFLRGRRERSAQDRHHRDLGRLRLADVGRRLELRRLRRPAGRRRRTGAPGRSCARAR